MSSCGEFFDCPSEQSRVKAKIVTSYFTAWSRVIRDHWNKTIPIGYIDLFCGPGVYQDGTKSVPIMLVESVLKDDKIKSRIQFLFNDMDMNNIHSLKSSINDIEGSRLLDAQIFYTNEIIDSTFADDIKLDSKLPILSFVDPFGYKGLTMELINKLIRNKGSDCIFFFNYNRINMALSSNTKFDEYLTGIFGLERAQVLKERLRYLSAEQREPMIINSLIESLKENDANYVLPFKFYSVDMIRTSHFIIFVTKNDTACRIMKQIMYSNSAKDVDGVASFEFKDSANFGNTYEQLFLFDRPLDNLCIEIAETYKTPVLVKNVCDKYELNINNRFVKRNVKDALIKLEECGRLVVLSGRKQTKRNGRLNMPDGALVRIIR